MEQLLLKNQLCFPLYACSKEVIGLYKPYLNQVGITYTQYITLLVLWEKGQCSVKELGEYLYLDSGTLTPLLKKLEAEQFIIRARSLKDERSVFISLTQKGKDMEEQVKDIPKNIACSLGLEPEEAVQLYSLLYKVLKNIETE